MSEYISFHIHDNFKIKIGLTDHEVVVPRMKFITGGKVITRIAQIQGKDIKGAINVLMQVQKGGDVSVIENIESVVSALIKEKNFDIIIELISMISEGTITEEIINQYECQHDEVLKILSYLIDGNFSSLKNLFASLKVITSSGQ
jgi:DNA polymerase III delta prime subunit